MPNKRKATKRKRELQKARAVQKKLKRQILHYIRCKRNVEAGLLMERYKNRYGAL